MAFYIDWAERLQAVRTMLTDNVQVNDPRNYAKLTGMLNFLLGPQNPKTINAIQQANSNSGQYRSVEIKYTPHKGTSNVITSDASGNCNKVAQRRDFIATYQPTLYVEDKFTIEENWIRQNRENTEAVGARLAMEFQDAMRNGREDMDRQLLSKAYGLVGANPAAGGAKDSFKDVELLKSDGTVNPETFDVIRNEMEDNFMTGEPAMIGMGNARRLFNRWAIGNLNTSGGFDVREIANQFGSVLYKDQNVGSVYSDANHVIVAYPGLTQFYQYNLFKGEFALTTPDNRIKGTMPDPVYPILWDYILEYDKDCENSNGLQGAWTGRVLTYFDLFTVPEEAFGEPYGDLVDFNGLVGYRITQASA